MLAVKNTLVSLDLFEKKFNCHLDSCKGACCVEGDFGAPLRPEEIDSISQSLAVIQPFMTRPAKELLAKEGFITTDPFGEKVTVCINKKDCIFVYRKNRISYCAIEKAWASGKSTFRKPVSCHLYPVRIHEMAGLIAVNYNKWHICSPALQLGKRENVPLYIFLKEALVRRFGIEWYEEVEMIAGELKREGIIDE